MDSRMPSRPLMQWISRRVERELIRFGLRSAKAGEKERNGSDRIWVNEEEFFSNEERYVKASQQGSQVIVRDGNGGTQLVLGSSPENPFPVPESPQDENGECPVAHSRPDGEISPWLR